jgi:hypothetical protein
MLADSLKPDAPPVCPGNGNPDRLVSRWEMEQLSGVKLHAALHILDQISCYWRNAPPLGDAEAARFLGQQRRLSEEERAKLGEGLRSIEAGIRDLGLPTSAEAVQELRIELEHIPVMFGR